jgi:hypothetical protein
MRTIKFKAIAINTKKWIESMTIAKGTIKRKSGSYYFETEENVWKGVIPETICEFIGVIDKTGKEIYEGDICKRDRHTELYEIVFYKNAWAITHETDNGIWHQEFCNGARGAELTVIGNIHDK